MSQKSKNILSTKTKNIEEKEITLDSLNNLIKVTSTKIKKSNEAHIFIRQSSKLCSDQTRKFPWTTRSGN